MLKMAAPLKSLISDRLDVGNGKGGDSIDSDNVKLAKKSRKSKGQKLAKSQKLSKSGKSKCEKSKKLSKCGNSSNFDVIEAR